MQGIRDSESHERKGFRYCDLYHVRKAKKEVSEVVLTETETKECVLADLDVSAEWVVSLEMREGYGTAG